MSNIKLKVGDRVRLITPHRYRPEGEITSISPCGDFLRFDGRRDGYAANIYEAVETPAKRGFYVFTSYAMTGGGDMTRDEAVAHAEATARKNPGLLYVVFEPVHVVTAKVQTTLEAKAL